MHFSCGIVRPPYEAGSCFLQVTSGCSHNKCRFCTFYKEAPFSVSPESEIREDLQEIRDSGLSIFPDTPLMEEVRRGEFIEASETEKIQELYTFVNELDIHTLLDATNVSNMMPVYGYLPEEREKILAMLKQGADEQGEKRLRMRRDSMRSL